ncbi:MAG: sigma-70 family RNA polymerase sigma factor [Vicinamibacteria bacterium]|jgi:RNA polymerase sigma-70 factor (ECF subfamily)|nr:sigma-70 family RNA polymerase sigma factor [Vicinamibacteria bacterium]
MLPPDLLRRIEAGDRAALADLYDQHASLVNALCLRILRDRAEAEEVLQEVFLQAWRQAGRYDPARGSVTSWLAVIARSRSLDRLRRRAARREAPEDAIPVGVEMPRTAEAIAVRDALQALPPPQRRALELAYYEGLTQVEIAERTGLPLGTIKTRMRTALLRLREALGPPRA